MEKFVVFSVDIEFGSVICNALLDAGHQLILFTNTACFSTHQNTFEDLKAIELLNIDLLPPDMVENKVSSYSPDVLISAIYAKKIPASIFKQAKQAFNVHPALLPKYKGASVWGLPIRFGDTETGITFHQMTEEFDAGPICHCAKVSLNPRENLYSLVQKMYDALPNAWAEFYLNLMRGSLVFQANEGGSYFPPLVYQDTWIDFKKSVSEIDAHIRSLGDKAPAYCFLGNSPLYIMEAVSTSIDSSEEKAGTLIDSSTVQSELGDRLWMATVDHYLEIRCLSHIKLGLMSGLTFIEKFSLKEAGSLLLRSCFDIPALNKFSGMRVNY